MSLFEFITSMISVLIALAIAQQLVSIGRLAQNHRRVRFYLPHMLWNVAVFLLAFLHWWSLWDFRDLPWNSAMFFYSLAGPLLLFFAVTLLSPEILPGDEPIDLGDHYRDMRKLFLGVFAFVLLFMALDGPLFGTEPLFNSLRLFQGLIICAITGAFLLPRYGAQVLFSGVVVLVMVLGAAARFLPGGVVFWP